MSRESELSKIESELSKLESDLSKAKSPQWINLGGGQYIAVAAVATLSDNGHETTVNGEMLSALPAASILTAIDAEIILEP